MPGDLPRARARWKQAACQGDDRESADPAAMITLGILGVGGLAGSLVRGLSGLGHQMVLSPRNLNLSAQLAEAHGASVATSNQDVVDRSDALLVCLPAEAGVQELGRLTFRPGQTVLSIMAGVDRLSVSRAVAPARAFLSMMPGYANAHGLGPCLLHPSDPFWSGVLGPLGSVIPLDDEPAFTVAATFGAFSGATLDLMARTISWFESQGLPPEVARALVAGTIRGNAEVVLRDPATLAEMSSRVTTPGGITTQLVGFIQERGGFDAWIDGLDAVHRRLNHPA